MNLKNKIIKAVNNNKLKLIEGTRSWYSYSISITEMVWTRNLFDGYQIDIYDKDTNIFIERIYV